MRDPSPYAGKTMRLRPDAAELGGHPIEVVDWYERTGPRLTWRQAHEAGDPRAQNYAIRRALGDLPGDDDVLFSRVDGMGQIVHLSEIEGVSGPVQNQHGPAMADQRAVGQPCPACRVPLAANDWVAVLPLGPGPDPQARVNARAGMPYQAVVIEIHWACHTGDESYSTEG